MYEKQNFSDGSVLTAEQLNHMETGISEVHDALPKKLPAPTTAKVGDYLRISAVNADGSFTVEAVAAPTVPTEVSAFENDAGYATEARVQELLAEFPSFEITVVQELPAEGAAKTIYLVPFADDSGSYLEYLYVNGAWEVIGSRSGENVDLTGYATETWVQEGFQPKGDYLTAVPAGYATEEFVKNKIAEAELGGEEVDLSGYAQKSELPTKTSQLTNDSGFITKAPVESVNGKTGDVQLSASDVGARPNSWTPTAQEVGALPDTYTPPDQTAEQVGADPKGTAASAVSAHNTSGDSHNDIRLLIDGLASGKLDADKLTEAINTALAQAKESGEFDGEAGKTAYQYAQNGGYTGTEVEFAKKLANEIAEFTKSEFSELTVDELAQRYTAGTRLVIVNDEYENLVPDAISANGGVYYGCGYQNGAWLNSSGAIEPARQSCVTGFIPYSKGSVITIKGSKGKAEQSGQYVATYDESFTLIGISGIQTLLSATSGTSTTDEKNLYKFVIDTSVYKATPMFSSASYIRISLNPCEGEDVVVSMGGEGA